ncbi:MAG: serine/threonine protein kinase [Pseudomonadales bacterium]|nr:serine/threonine protein kinase [Pseudomonadales bacterium]
MELHGFSQLENIAEGGMAVLYRGIQTSLNRPVAIKVLKSALNDTPEAREMFEWESKIVARLDHPNIIRVIDKGLTPDGMPFFVMDFVEGVTLKEALKAGMADRRKLRLIIQVAKALSYAHKNGIIHRDIKPGNILIDKEGNARVVDFGIARIFSEDTELKQRSEEGITVGTLAYMAPEQHMGAVNTSELSDIYSLGVIIYLMFTDKLPKPGYPAPSHFNPKLPKALDTIVMQCLADEPSQRPTAEQLIAKLLKSFKGAHLKKEQKQEAKASFQDPKEKFRLLDIIKETEFSTVSLYENREDQSLMVLKKRINNFSGYSEAEILSRLKHRNIINIRGVTRNDRIFILVMEYLSGGNLQARMARPMDLDVFMAIANQICDALSFAHNNRITHGNLRPQNILFNELNEAIVMDFGFPPHYEEDAEYNWYQLENEPKTPQTDIYSAGVIFYQLLTGHLPQWENEGLIEYDLFKKLSPKLQALLKSMLQHDPTLRTQSFDDVKQQLNQVALKTEEPKVKKSPEKKSVSPQKKSSNTPALALVALLLICLNTGLFIWIGKQQGWPLGWLDKIPLVSDSIDLLASQPESKAPLEKPNPAPVAENGTHNEWDDSRVFAEDSSEEEELEFEIVQ